MKPPILHYLTPLARISPFDVNMAIDAGFTVATYTGVTLDEMTALTQDAMFSRAPEDAARTCLFIGGKDAALALDMADRALAAMFPPFRVSVFVDPAGAFTTAAAMVAVVERQLARDGTTLEGKRVAVFGAKGVIGGVLGVIAARRGARVTLVAHDETPNLAAKAADFKRRFDVELDVARGVSPAEKGAALRVADVALTAARAGLEVLSAEDLSTAPDLRLVADINAVAPLGVAGLALGDDGVLLPGGRVKGIGALAIGGVKYQTQHRLLLELAEGREARGIDFDAAGEMARTLVAASA